MCACVRACVRVCVRVFFVFFFVFVSLLLFFTSTTILDLIIHLHIFLSYDIDKKTGTSSKLESVYRRKVLLYCTIFHTTFFWVQTKASNQLEACIKMLEVSLQIHTAAKRAILFGFGFHVHASETGFSWKDFKLG